MKWRMCLLAVVVTGTAGCGGATDCEAMGEQWDSYVSAPGMDACATTSDCVAVGGQPPTDPCNGYSAIGYCGVAVNAQAYDRSPAPRLEEGFAAAGCSNRKAYDCSPAYAECVSGRCVVRFPGCCGGCRPDSGYPTSVDAPFTPIDSG